VTTQPGVTSLGIWKRWSQHLWRFSRRQPLGAVGGLGLALLVFAALFAPLVATHDPLKTDAPSRLQAPSAQAFLGTDHLGRDMFSRIIHGARISLYVGLISVTTGVVIGTLAGVGSAYAGGQVDLLVQRFVDGMQGIPSIILALAMVVALGASINNVTIAIAVTLAPRVIRLARSEALAVKHEDYILASRSVGAVPIRIVLRHILPNSLTGVIVLATGYLGTAVVVEAALSFLGLGVPPPHPSWGGILQYSARNYQEVAPWLTIFPGLALALTVFGFNLFGDAIRDTMDPRLRGA